MALVKRYEGSAKDSAGNTFTASIYQEGYSGPVTPLELSGNGLRHTLQRKTNDAFWNVAIDIVELTVNDVDKLREPSTLSSIMSAGEKEVQLQTSYGWNGWLKPVQTTYDRYLPGTITLQFVSGIAFLDTIPYTDEFANRIRGYDDFIGVINYILGFTDQTISGYRLATNWHTKLPANDLVEVTNEPLFHIAAEREIFEDDAEDPAERQPLTMMGVLEQLLYGMQLRLWFWDGYWWIMHRDLSPTHLVDDNTVQIWDYPASLTSGILEQEVRAYDMEPTPGTPRSFRGANVQFETPVKSVSATYLHRPASYSLLGNRGFEQAIQSTSGDAIGNWKPSSALIERIHASRLTGVWALFMPVEFNNTGNFFEVVPNQIVPYLGFTVHQIASYVEGGAGVFFNFTAWVRYIGDGNTEIGGVGQGYTAIRIRIGTHWVCKAADGSLYLDDSPALYEHYLVYFLGYPQGFLNIALGDLELVDGLSAAVSGQLTIYLHNVAEDHNLSSDGLSHGRGSVWDDIDWNVTTNVGGRSPEATKYFCVDTTSGNIRQVDGAPTLFGSGPTLGHRARLKMYDSTFTLVEAPADWQVGTDYSGGESNMTLHELWCDVMLRQSQIPLSRITAKFSMDQGIISPHMLLRDKFIAPISFGGAVAGNDFVITTLAPMPSRSVDIGGEIHTVTGVVDNGNDTFTVSLDGTLAGSHTGALIQTIYYTWDRLVYDWFDRSVDSSWTELYSGPGGSPGETQLNTNASGGLSSGSSALAVFASNNIRVIPNVSVLATEAVGSDESVLMVQEYGTGYGHGGGLFMGDPTDTSTPADAGTVFISADGKRWKRVEALQNKPYCPTWWGARFNAGTTDDGPAIQAAIDAVPNNGKVVLPPGIARIDTGIVLDGKPVTIEGAGDSFWGDTGYLGTESPPDSGNFPYPFPAFPDWAGTVLRSGPALTDPIFTITDDVTDSERRNAVRIRYLHLVGNMSGVNEGTATDTFGIHLIGAWWVKIEHCSINNFTSHGIAAITDPSGVGSVTDLMQVRACHVSGNGGWGISANCPDGWITDCRISNNTTGGVLLGSSQMQIKDSWVDINAGVGIRANGAKANMIANCIVNDNGSVGIWIGDGTTAVRNYHVHGNHVSNNGANLALPLEQRAGIWVMGGADHVINDNNCFDDEVQHTQTYGLYINSGWRNVRMIGNVFSGNSIDPTNLLTNNPEGVYNVIEHGLQQRTIDCASHLQALIDLVDEGSTLYFPEGNYLLNSTVVVAKAMRFLGQATDDLTGNEGSYIQSPVTLDGPAIQVTAGGVSFERLNFFGNVGAPTTSAVGISFESGTGGRVDQCMFSNYRGPGVKVLAPAANVWITDCIFIGGASHGILNQASNVRIHGSEFRQNDGHGIYCLIANDARVTDNFVWQNGLDGIRLESGNRCFASLNTCRDNAQAGIRIQSGAKHAADNNTCNGNGTDTGVADIHRSGIAVIGGDRISVCHNYCGGGQYGISFGSALTSATILDNRFDDNGVGPYLWDATSQPGLDIDLSGITEIDFGNLPSGTIATTNVTLDGVLAGDAVMVGAPSNWPASLLVFASCTAANTIRVVAFNTNGGTANPDAGDWKFAVSRRGGTATAAPPPALSELSMEHSYANHNILAHA